MWKLPVAFTSFRYRIAIRGEEVPLSSTDSYFREEGEVLHDERENMRTLEGIRNQIGAHNFAAQYQQHPKSPEQAAAPLGGGRLLYAGDLFTA